MASTAFKQKSHFLLVDFETTTIKPFKCKIFGKVFNISLTH